ncbi:isoprenylcysteine carboxyl methyltransferase family protein [Inquilinus limosus]|uniref:isoprenylcysteine carboxyl methyltransferase family protein n=1 Tax=Inquilinus limosus TaxID=171674 RepID=UPI000690F739|nr:isoprenylcysteine carboxylmethyltransferase family protein [Inquilinus limosus]
MMLGWAQWVALLVAAQRLAELAYARRNESRLRARGAVESGARHYPLFILLHGAWLLAVFLLIPADRAPSWPLLALFLLLQAARVWVVATLGPYWTTRVLSLPGAPLVRRGPYRWVRHPNYVVVAAEIAVLPLAFDAWTIAIVFSLANALLLRHRIGIEEGALAGRS